MRRERQAERETEKERKREREQCPIKNYEISSSNFAE